jgi:uncharacterized membrane protein YkgB
MVISSATLEETMQSQRSNTDRWFAAAGGIGFGALTILGWAFWAAPNFPKLNPGIPSLSDSPASVANYYAQHANTTRIGALLGTIALLPLLCFIVALYNRLRAAEGGSGSFSLLALLAGVMVCVVHFVFLSFLFQAAFRPHVVGVQATNALHYAGTAGAAASILYATLLFAVAVVTLRHRALPRWIGLLAAIAAPLQFLYIPSIFGAQHSFDVTVGLFGVYLSFGTFLPWCIAAGVAMARPAPAPSAVTARASDLSAMTSGA